jgi:hypothetical protein
LIVSLTALICAAQLVLAACPVRAFLSAEEWIEALRPVLRETTPRPRRFAVLRFKPNSAAFTEEARKHLDPLADAIRSATLHDQVLRIKCYADSSPQSSSTQALNDQRAAAIQKYLRDRTPTRLAPLTVEMATDKPAGAPDVPKDALVIEGKNLGVKD